MARSIDSISKKKKQEELPEQPTQTLEEAKTQPEQTAETKVDEVTSSQAESTEPAEQAATPVETPNSAPTEAAEEAEAATTETAPTSAEEDSFEKLFPEPSVVVEGPPTWVWWVLLVIGAAVLGFLAFDLTRQRIDNWLQITSPAPTESVSISPTNTPPSEEPSSAVSPTPTATPTPSAEAIVKSSITLRVLNGTRIAGAAGTARDTLVADGFTVRTTGNARNQTYTNTYVYYQAGRKAEAELVAATLASYSPILEESTLASPDMVLVVVAQ